jgi:hypothetical protein
METDEEVALIPRANRFSQAFWGEIWHLQM